MALCWLLCSLIVCVFGNGFDLKELTDEQVPSDPLTKDKAKMDLIQFMMTLHRRGQGVKRNFITRAILGKYKIKPKSYSRFFLSRLSHSKEENNARMRPQYIITYNKKSKALIVYFEGTEKDSENYDYTNMINVVPKEILLTEENKKIEVHTGIYNAINTRLFYAGSKRQQIKSFLNDIQLIINNIHKAKKSIKKLYLTGFSQGASIATVIPILWQSNVNCKFVKYFKRHASKELQTLLDNSGVVAFAAPGVFGHQGSGALQIDAIYGDKILNIINAEDPIPMGFNGKNKKPRGPFKENEDTFIDAAQLFVNAKAQALMDEFDEKAYFGPVGRYTVIIEKKKWFGLKRDKVMLKRLDKNTIHQLYQKHLVNGAHTIVRLGLGQFSLLINCFLNHKSETYREPLSAAVKRYKEMMNKQDINMWIVMYLVELFMMAFICCGMGGIAFVKCISQYNKKTIESGTDDKLYLTRVTIL